MDLQKAENLMLQLMDAEGLLDKGWRFEFDKPWRRLGQCNYSRQLITLSWRLVEVNGEEVIKDAIAHEVAHALAGYAASPHGSLWKSVAVRLGATPKHCIGPNDNIVAPSRYAACCGVCGRVAKSVGKPRAPRQCRNCSVIDIHTGLAIHDPQKVLRFERLDRLSLSDPSAKVSSAG